MLINQETKLARLESINEKLAEAYEKTRDTEAIKQFQTTLDEETEFTESVITKISELKILKEETEKNRKELEVSKIKDNVFLGHSILQTGLQHLI